MDENNDVKQYENGQEDNIRPLMQWRQEVRLAFFE